MRVVALLVFAAACATPAPHRTEVDVPNRRPPAPPPPPPQDAPVRAKEIIQAQAKSHGIVTPAFDPVEANLRSESDRLVADSLEVIEAIGTRITEMARECRPKGDLDTMLCGFDDLDTLVDHIDGLLIWLRRHGRCAAMVPVERAAKQFQRVPRFQRTPPQVMLDRTLVPDPPPDDSLPIRVFICGMVAVRGQVAACYAQHKVPGTVTLNVVIGKDGTMTSAVATGQFAGTPTGTCVETAARTATFPPSDGLRSPYPFVLPPPSPKPAGH